MVRLILALCVMVVGLAACGSQAPEAMPSDFALSYAWREGSLPPPHHYEYDISVDASGAGTIVYRPDYTDEPEWTASFAVAPADREAVYTALRAAGAFDGIAELEDGRVGGAYSWVSGTVAGSTFDVPSSVAPNDEVALRTPYGLIERLVPEATWAELAAQRQAYIDAYTD